MLTTQQIENLPIDISSSKLLDWLIDRRHVDLKWPTSALAIREKINAAIQDMPEVDEIKELLAGTYINYFHCVRIVELLRISESGSKNIFGYYSSQRMKDWKEIIRLYEKDNINIGEAAQMLTRNVSYEIPSLKKQVAKCQQLQAECLKKEKDYLDGAGAAKVDYHAACRKLGIKGDRIKRELLEKVRALPDTFASLTEKTRRLSVVIEFYIAFVKFNVCSESDQLESKILPMMRFFQANGNATVYHWRTGEAPGSVEEVDLSFLEEDDERNKTDEIDWGDIVDTNEDGGIDFGITLQEGGSEVIDSDIKLAEESSGNGTSRHAPLIARGTDAFTLLDNPETRKVFTNELLELEAFLKQRLSEMKDDIDILSASQFDSAPSILQMKTAADVSGMLKKVREMLAVLTDNTVQHLLHIKSSPKYVDRLTESLKQKRDLEEKMLACREAVHNKSLESVEEEKRIQSKVTKLVANTRTLQKQIEQEISARYKNRPVNLMGAINTI